MRGFLLSCAALVVALLVYRIGSNAVEEAGRVEGSSALPRFDPFPRSRPLLPQLGGLVEDDEGPLGDAVVALSPLDGGREATMVTGETGSWDVAVEPGRYRVAVSRAGYLPQTQELRLPATGKLVTRLTRGGELVTGGVTDMFGTPVVEARVELFGDDDELLGVTTSRDRGAFAISIARRYTYARASHDSFVPTSQRYVSGPLALRLWPGVRIQGAVVREDGEPCPDAEVSFEVESGQLTTLRSTTRADATGQFSLTVARGQARIEAVGPGCASASPLLTTIDAPRSLAIVTGRGYQLTGRVVDRESHAPIAGAKVELDFEVASAQHDAITDGQGMFRFVGVIPDKLKVLVEHAEHLREIGKSFDFKTDQVVEISLERGRIVRGRVEPPAIAELQFDLETWSSDDLENRRAHDVKARSNADGTFVLPRVPDGTHTLVATTAGGMTGRVVLEVSRDRDDVRLTLAADGAATLAGRVIDEAKNPVANHDVVVSSDWFENRRVRTDADGKFRVEQLAAGEPDVVVVGRERIDAGKIVLAATGTMEVTLVVRRIDAVFRGRVIDDNGPVANATVGVIKAGTHGMFKPEALTASNGSFEIRGMPDESVDLRVDSALGDLVGLEHAVEPGASVVIHMKRLAEVTVAATREGKPVRSFGLSCQRGQYRTSQSVHTYDGTVTVHLGGEGEVQCHVESERWGAEVRTTGGRVALALAPLAVFVGQASSELQIMYFAGSAPPPSVERMMFSDRYITMPMIDEQGRFELITPPGPGVLVIRKAGSTTSVTRAITGTSGGRVDLGTLTAD